MEHGPQKNRLLTWLFLLLVTTDWGLMVWHAVWFDGLNFSCFAFLFRYSLFSSICTNRRDYLLQKSIKRPPVSLKWSYKDLQTYQAISVPMFLLKRKLRMCWDWFEYIDSICFFQDDQSMGWAKKRERWWFQLLYLGKWNPIWRLAHMFFSKWLGSRNTKKSAMFVTKGSQPTNKNHKIFSMGFWRRKTLKNRMWLTVHSWIFWTFSEIMPIGSMYGLFTYTWLKIMVKVGHLA